MANKTKLAQTLDDSHRHATEVEETLQEWQLVMRESQQQVEQLQVCKVKTTCVYSGTSLIQTPLRPVRCPLYGGVLISGVS